MTSIYREVNQFLARISEVETEAVAREQYSRRATEWWQDYQYDHAAIPEEEQPTQISPKAQLKLELQRLFTQEKLKLSRFPIVREDERDTTGLPVEAPFDLNPYHLDDFSTPSGRYKDEVDNIDHRKMEDLEADPYRGGDWYANQVYGTNSLVGGGGKRKYNILLTRAFAESMSIGLSKDVSLDPRRLGTNPDPKDQVEGWYRLVLAPRDKPTIGTPREAWRLPLATWIQSLSRDEAAGYLCNARIVYRHARMLKAHSLLKVLEYAGTELKSRVLDTEETYC